MKIHTLITVSICLLLTQTMSAPADNFFDKEGISEMNKLNKLHLYNENQYMVAYISQGPSCDEDCQETIQLLQAVKQDVKPKFDLKIVYVDASENKKLTKELRVVEIPSIAYLANKKAVVYPDDYDLETLSKWLKRRVIKPSEGFGKTDDYDKIRKAENLLVTYSGLRNRYYQMFRYVASSYSNLHFVHSFSAPILKYYNRTVRFEKHVGKTTFSLEAPFNQETLTAFIDKHFYQLRSLDKRTLKRIMVTEPASIVLVHEDPFCSANVDFAVAAETMAKEMLAVSTPVTLDKHQKKFLRFLGIGPMYKEVPLPSLHIIQRGADERVRKYRFEGELSTQSILQFFNDWKAGILKPFWKTQQVEENEEDKNTVKALVGSQLESKVLNKLKDVVVFFHSVWCMDCPEILRMYEKIGEKFSHIEDLVFYSIDSFSNEGELVPDAIDGEPVLRIFKGDDKENPLEFEGSWVLSELEKFISSSLMLNENKDL